ncbi:alpha/beta hydrolase [Rhodobacteraceae bacterium CCMM004]|nr:alpha/beta hydrolase [Rhodobacteraceae bacterium CCMM004]
MAAAPLLTDGPAGAPTILLGHGAGVAMDAPWMAQMTAALVVVGFRVVRYEFTFMAARRKGSRRPPPRAEALLDELRATVDAVPDRPLILGGKSLGGRAATLVADDIVATGVASGAVCFGYPFHPPKRPETLRTAHLETLSAPCLICQGTRDPFGSRDEVAGYRLSPAVTLHWLEDGDHDLAPRKRSGHTLDAHMASAAERTAAWAATLRRGGEAP